MIQPTIIGWDIGGAHVKAALTDSNGRLLQVSQEPCPLWQGLEQLRSAVNKIMQAFSIAEVRHAVTMTGELVDLFANRESGVRQIITTLTELLSPQPITIFAGKQGFLSLAELKPEHYPAIASANWLATARYVAQRQEQGLLIDIGSTTTDILLFKDRSVQTEGFTDYQRLVSGELIYTGIIRTAVMAVAQRAFFNGREQGLMAEYFATMADVYRLTGELQEQHDQTATADGGEKTICASALRLSRMTGYDFIEADLTLWRQFAQHIRSRQLQLIQAGCERQLSRNRLAPASCLVGAGVGRFLVKSLAMQFGFTYVDFDSYFSDPIFTAEMHAADCAPAVAVACLLLNEL